MKESDRGYTTLILESELLASSPERVYQWLETRAAKAKEQKFFNDDLDEIAEKALLKRGNSLIDLALARFTKEPDVAIELFNRAHKEKEEDNSPSWVLRLAVLSNEAVGKGPGLRQFPHVLFGRNDESVVQWISTATPNELFALFHNPTAVDYFLREFLEGGKYWKALDEGRRLMAIYALSKNPRMSQTYDGGMDGYAEYSHGAVFSAAWKLAEIVPTTRQWAHALWDFFAVLERDAPSAMKPLEVAKRWFPDPSDETALKDEDSLHESGCLGVYQNVRSNLADLALSKGGNVGKDLLASDDVAFRVAAYRKMRLTPEQILAAYERDKSIAAHCAAYNENLWRSEKTRSALHDIAWKAVRENKHSDLDAANTYNRAQEAMEKKHPEWFVDVEPAPEISETRKEPILRADIHDESVTKADVENAVETEKAHDDGSEQILAIVKQLNKSRGDGNDQILATLKQLNAGIQGLSTTLRWVWWFSLVALAVMLFSHC